MNETYEQMMRDSDMVFTAVSNGAFDNFQQAEQCVARFYIPDMDISRSGICHALNRLKKFYAEQQLQEKAENKLWFDGYDYYVAESAEEAQKLQIELTGRDAYRDEQNNFQEVDPGSDVTIYDDAMIDNRKSETRKAKEWVVGRTKGLLASTEI